MTHRASCDLSDKRDLVTSVALSVLALFLLLTLAGTPVRAQVQNFNGQDTPSSWGVNGGAYLQYCSGGMTVINNRMLGLVAVNNRMWSRGRHTLNFGAQLRRTYQDTID